jgi:phenazine biosynthesis protein PhzF family
MKYYVVDAFTDRLFSGNPAGVCLPEKWPRDDVMQSIAFENNLAETAFAVPRGAAYDLRWFTPLAEVDLCGHATLATAHVLMSDADPAMQRVEFHSQSGPLFVLRSGDIYTMDFPSRPPTACEAPALLERALGVRVLETHRSRDLLALVEDEAAVQALSPDFSLLKQIDVFAVAVTARGQSCDFVSRFFAPRAGIPEDPVTGSSHAALIPFWSRRLGKKRMTARQLSRRGGRLYCEDCGERVKIGGKAVCYLKGEIDIHIS